jgi:hypothetical protein
MVLPTAYQLKTIRDCAALDKAIAHAEAEDYNAASYAADAASFAADAASYAGGGIDIQSLAEQAIELGAGHE